MSSQPTSYARPQLKRRHAKGQGDHVDALLMSYADLITLLFMMFVIFVSVSVSRNGNPLGLNRGEPPRPAGQKTSGTLELNTPFDEAYRMLVGFVVSHHADQAVAVEKTGSFVSVDLSAVEFFEKDSASINAAQAPALYEMARIILAAMSEGSRVAVEGHADPGVHNGWTLPALRAARVAELLQQAGVDPARIRATNFAGTRPIVPSRDPAGNAIRENQLRNQRIIIRLEHAQP
jgi:chemotaxis protein MotB